MPQGIVDALKSFGEVYDKHSKRHSGFPFYIIEETNPGSKLLRNALGLKDTSELEIIAVNAKRMWWRNYPGQEYSHDAVEAWVDAIRMNEGKRDKLPESLVTETPEEQDEDIPQPPKKDADDDENKAQRDDHDEL
jgi:protein disulfide-isomerase A6